MKTIIWILASVTAAALLPFVIFRPSETGDWEAMTTRLTEMKHEAVARKLPRSVLRGIPTPGNAWEHYNIAIDGVANKAESAFMLRHVSLGAQRQDGQYPYDWKEKTPGNVASTARGERIAGLATAQARAAVEIGKPQDALDLLLDTLVFARDISTNGDVFSSKKGFEVYKSAFNELLYLVRSRELTSAQLTQLADTLKTVERELPDSGTALTNETMRIGFLISEVDEQFSQLVWRREWRWAMFPRKTIADAFRRRDDELQRIKGIDQMDFKAAKEELERISNESFA
ncbi:MAG TPA: hypothetical protein VMB70_00230, partial [Terriglobia bacterium]|nr:hypothetical protein [Terriglobia bacterium]